MSVTPLRPSFAAIRRVVVVAMIGSLLVIATAPGAGVRAVPAVEQDRVGPSTTVIVNTTNLCSTPIELPNGTTGGTLNNITCHPWGEAFDPVNRCLYVTENPASPATTGYLTTLGLSQATPVSFPIWGGDNPEGIAWARAYLGEPSNLVTYFSGGVLLIADSGSNGLSLFGLTPNSTKPLCWPTFLGTESFYVNWHNGTPLVSPFDVAFARTSRLFYVTWYGSSVVGAYSGLNPGCQIYINVSAPAGLSFGYGSIYIANFQDNGWVTALPAVTSNALPGLCGPVTTSAPILDRPIWTTPAPALDEAPSGTPTMIATSDGDWSVPRNVQGLPISGCALGTPSSNVAGYLSRSSLACIDSVNLPSLVSPPVRLSYGDTYAPTTHHVYTVLQSLGDLTATGYLDNIGVYGVGSMPVEVVWFPSPNVYPFLGPGDPTGEVVVTNWGSGTLTQLTAY